MDLLIIFQVFVSSGTYISTTLKAAALSGFTQATDLLNFEAAKNCNIFLKYQISKFYLCKKRATLHFTYSILTYLKWV